MEVREAIRVKIRSVGEFTDDRPQVPLNWIWLDGKRQILGEMKGSQNSLCVWVTIGDLGGGGFWVTDTTRMRGMAGVLGVSLRKKQVISANWSTPCSHH